MSATRTPTAPILRMDRSFAVRSGGSRRPVAAVRGDVNGNGVRPTIVGCRRSRFSRGWVSKPQRRWIRPRRPIRRSPRARSMTASNIAGVSRPVNVFCWLGGRTRAGTYRPIVASAPCPKRGLGRGPRGRASRQRPQRRVPPERSERDQDPDALEQRELASEVRSAGVALVGSSACWPAARSGRRPRCTHRSGSGRRRRGATTAGRRGRPRGAPPTGSRPTRRR